MKQQWKVGSLHNDPLLGEEEFTPLGEILAQVNGPEPDHWQWHQSVPQLLGHEPPNQGPTQDWEHELVLQQADGKLDHPAYKNLTDEIVVTAQKAVAGKANPSAQNNAHANRLQRTPNAMQASQPSAAAATQPEASDQSSGSANAYDRPNIHTYMRQKSDELKRMREEQESKEQANQPLKMHPDRVAEDRPGADVASSATEGIGKSIEGAADSEQAKREKQKRQAPKSSNKHIDALKKVAGENVANAAAEAIAEDAVNGGQLKAQGKQAMQNLTKNVGSAEGLAKDIEALIPPGKTLDTISQQEAMPILERLGKLTELSDDQLRNLRFGAKGAGVAGNAIATLLGALDVYESQDREKEIVRQLTSFAGSAVFTAAAAAAVAGAVVSGPALIGAGLVIAAAGLAGSIISETAFDLSVGDTTFSDLSPW